MIDIYQYGAMILVGVVEAIYEYIVYRKLKTEEAKHHIKSHILLLSAFAICLTYLMLTSEALPIILWLLAVIWHLHKEARSICKHGHVRNLKGL